MKILLIGSGGREHALAQAILKSPLTSELFVAPGNGGTADYNVDVDVNNHHAVVAFCLAHDVELVVVGPEAPLVAGLVDHLEKSNIKAFGPRAYPAQLEGSKTFARQFAEQHRILGPRWASFTDFDQAMDWVDSVCDQSGECSVVIKADGLAAGKGVVLPETRVEVEAALMSILGTETLDGQGTSSEKHASGKGTPCVVLEERMVGEELSLIGITDGKTIIGFPFAQDHKRIGEGDTGPNTGGMGAYAPVPGYDSEYHAAAVEHFLKRAVDGMSQRTPYVGFLYAGLMVTEQGPRLVEYNCRLGDPEAQVLLELLDTDLVELMSACVAQRLDEIKVAFKPGVASTVVLAACGYPGDVLRAIPIPQFDCLDAIDFELEAGESVKVIHAGTCLIEATLRNCGGRVLNVVGYADDLTRSLQIAEPVWKRYVAETDGALFARSDIGWRHRSDYEPTTTAAFTDPADATNMCEKSTKAKYSTQKGNAMGAFSAAIAQQDEASSSAADAYAAAGVSLDAAAASNKRIAASVRSTHDERVVAGQGSFGGVFDARALKGMKDPLLVATTDGVGTKTVLAYQLNRWEGCGADIVNHGVNDVLVQGAEPLFFLDTVAAEHLDPEVVGRIIDGMAEACRETSTILLGGETAEMPGVLCEGSVDIAGTLIGVVERSKLLPKVGMEPGDVLIGLASSGLHTNGYSLARKVAADFDLNDPLPGGNGLTTIGDALLAVHRSYLAPLKAALDNDVVMALAHITGGGFIDNIPRVLPDDLGAKINVGSWPLPPLFSWLIEQGGLSSEAALQTLNCGIGMIAVVKPNEVEAFRSFVSEDTWIVGELKAGSGVELVGELGTSAENV